MPQILQLRVLLWNKRLQQWWACHENQLTLKKMQTDHVLKTFWEFIRKWSCAFLSASFCPIIISKTSAGCIKLSVLLFSWQKIVENPPQEPAAKDPEYTRGLHLLQPDSCKSKRRRRTISDIFYNKALPSAAPVTAFPASSFNNALLIVKFYPVVELFTTHRMLPRWEISDYYEAVWKSIFVNGVIFFRSFPFVLKVVPFYSVFIVRNLLIILVHNSTWLLFTVLFIL